MRWWASKTRHRRDTKGKSLFSLSEERLAALPVKTVKTVWVAATSDEVHSTQGLLEAQDDSQRLGNKGERVWGKAQSLLK